MRYTRRRVAAVLFTTFALVGAGIAPAAADVNPTYFDIAPTSAVTIDPTNRQSVQNAYLNVFLPALAVPRAWTGGDVATCTPGTFNRAAQDATLTTANYFRAMAGWFRVREIPPRPGLRQYRPLIKKGGNNPPGGFR
ncbi:MAG: hypothetical protein FWD83_10565, partial [Promicromonosporaceae bacterium]|nr:hypothetical protein [Promicromonosporaceae bacterium]